MWFYHISNYLIIAWISLHPNITLTQKIKLNYWNLCLSFLSCMKLNYVELELRRVNINSRTPNAQIWDILVNSDPEIFTEGYCFDFSLLYNKYLVAYNNHFIISYNFVVRNLGSTQLTNYYVQQVTLSHLFVSAASDLFWRVQDGFTHSLMPWWVE